MARRGPLDGGRGDGHRPARAAAWYVGGDGDTGSLHMWQQKMLWVIGINLLVAGGYTLFPKREPKSRAGAGR